MVIILWCKCTNLINAKQIARFILSGFSALKGKMQSGGWKSGVLLCILYFISYFCPLNKLK